MSTTDHDREPLAVIAGGKLTASEFFFRDGHGCIMVRTETGITVMVLPVATGAPASESYLLVEVGAQGDTAVRHLVIDFETPIEGPKEPPFFSAQIFIKGIITYQIVGNDVVLVDTDVSAVLLREPAKGPPPFLGDVP